VIGNSSLAGPESTIAAINLSRRPVPSAMYICSGRSLTKVHLTGHASDSLKAADIFDSANSFNANVILLKIRPLATARVFASP
jgi:hypothetical protein